MTNTITTPQLKVVTQSHLIAFEIEYEAYVERVSNVNQSHPQTQQIKSAFIRQCIQPKLLLSLCIIGRIEGATCAEEATDEKVKTWFEG